MPEDNNPPGRPGEDKKTQPQSQSKTPKSSEDAQQAGPQATPECESKAETEPGADSREESDRRKYTRFETVVFLVATISLVMLLIVSLGIYEVFIDTCERNATSTCVNDIKREIMAEKKVDTLVTEKLDRQMAFEKRAIAYNQEVLGSCVAMEAAQGKATKDRTEVELENAQQQILGDALGVKLSEVSTTQYSFALPQLCKKAMNGSVVETLLTLRQKKIGELTDCTSRGLKKCLE